MDAPRLLALIPAHNEAASIAAVVKGAAAQLPVLVVDDGSTDDTAALAAQAGAAVLRQTPNQGKGAALRAGFGRALNEGYAAVITLDADGQHDPAELPAFVAAFRARGAELIIGQRDFAQMPRARRWANSFGRWSFSWAIGQPIADNQSGYRLIERKLLAAALTSRERGFEFEVEMIVTCARQGWRLEWVPIRTIYAAERSHINGLKHTAHFIRLLWHTWRTLRQGRQPFTNA